MYGKSRLARNSSTRSLDVCLGSSPTAVPVSELRCRSSAASSGRGSLKDEATGRISSDSESCRWPCLRDRPVESEPMSESENCCALIRRRASMICAVVLLALILCLCARRSGSG